MQDHNAFTTEGWLGKNLAIQAMFSLDKKRTQCLSHRSSMLMIDTIHYVCMFLNLLDVVFV